MVEPPQWQKQPSPDSEPAAAPPPGYPAQSYPAQNYPGQGYPPPGHWPPGYPPPGYPPYAYQPPAPGEAKPSNNIGWAVGAVFLFWPLAIAAFYFAIKADEYWYAGNRAAAAKAAHDARVYGRLGVIVGAAFVVLGLLFFGISLAVIGASSSSSFPTGP